MTAVNLRRVDPAPNMRRFYRLDMQPDLFGGVLLAKEWGRIGTASGHGEKNSQRAYLVSIASISGIPKCAPTAVRGNSANATTRGVSGMKAEYPRQPSA